MSKAPAFQFYANDFMDATSTWEANAVGLYVRCLCKQWTHGSIPSDLRILARAIHCDRSELEACWDTIGPKFVQQEDGSLKNKRLEQVRERQEYVSIKRSEAGKAGAIAKANAKANGSTKGKQRKVKEKVEGDSGNERANETLILHIEDARFETLWANYGRIGSKPEAFRYWRSLNEPDRMAIEAKLPAYVASTPGGAFRKHLQGWINPKNRMWESAIVTVNPNHHGPVAKTQSERDAELAAIVAARYATQ